MTTFSKANISVGGDIQTLNNIAALRNYLPRGLRDGRSVIVSGKVTPGDADGGIYIWSEGNTDPDDGQDVIKPATSIASGRWLLAVGRGNEGDEGPEGPRGPIGLTGATGVAANDFGLFSTLATLTIDNAIKTLRSTGMSAVGVGVAVYSAADGETLPAEGKGVWWQTTANGRQFKLAVAEPDLFHYGAVDGGDINAILPIACRHTGLTDKTLTIPAGRFKFNGSLTGTRIRLTGTRPTFNSDYTSLQGGSIIEGSLWIKSTKVYLRDFGVDHGSAWFPSSPNDALKVSPYNDQTNTAIAGDELVVDGVVGLGTDQANYHAVLIENFDSASAYINNVSGASNLFAVAIKLTRGTISNIVGREANGRNVIIKCDATFGGAGLIDISNIMAESLSRATPYGVSVLVQGNRQMERILMRGVRSFGALRPFAVEVEIGSILNDLIITDFIIASGMGGNVNEAPIILNGQTYNPVLSNGVVKTNATQRSLIVAAGNTLDFSNVQFIIPNGGIMNAATIGSAVGSTFWKNVRFIAAYDAGLPANVEFNNNPLNNRIDSLSIFNPTGSGASIRPTTTKASIPTAGYYVTGEFVRNLTTTPDANGKILTGWHRMTTGATHVLNTDWRAIYATAA